MQRPIYSHLALPCVLALLTARQLEVARLKKRKLKLKDEIAMLADSAIPDIIA